MGYIAPTLLNIEYFLGNPPLSTVEHDEFLIYPLGFESYLDYLQVYRAYITASVDSVAIPLDMGSLEELPVELIKYEDGQFTIHNSNTNLTETSIWVVLL